MAVPQQPKSSDPPEGTLDVQVPGDSPTGAGGGLGDHASPHVPRAQEPHPPRRSWAIGAAILATVVVGLSTVSVLYYQWYRTETRDALIIVWGPDDGAWDGATVTVSPSSGPGLVKRLTREENMLARFHVPPGHYLVRVKGPDGKLLAERRTHPERPMLSKMIWWPFRAPPAATQLGFQ